MAHTCSECTYLKVGGDTKYGKYWCESKCDWIYADAQECWKFCSAYSRSSSVAKSAYDYSKSSQSSGCYITTALCGVLGMDDNNEYLNTLREFRNNYLQKNKKGLEILVEYDVVGPKISEHLKDDGGKFNISYMLFNNFIIPTVSAIKSENYDKAIEVYTSMTEKLIKYYEIDRTVDVSINEVEPSLCGHGRLQKKLAF